ncbi:MAG: peptidoglycan DD-metalloendopeptidase family protein, partial [Bacteroidota bacterium]
VLTQVSKSSVTVNVENDEPIPVVIFFTLYNDTLDSKIVGEDAINVASKGKVTLLMKPNQDELFSSKVLFRSRYELGVLNRDAPLDNAFLIPFPAGQKARVCQSPDGTINTHKTRPEAIDFCIAEKSPIIASKDGIVIALVQHYTLGGLDPALYNKANYIDILHDDGLISDYGHIFPNSSTLKVGDHVNKGDVIALVGNVGFSGAPHLHFEVKQLTETTDEYNERHKRIRPNFYSLDGKKLDIKYGLNFDSNGVIKPEFPKPVYKAEAANASCGGSELKDAKAKGVDCYGKRNYAEAIRYLTAHVANQKDDRLSLVRIAIAYTRIEKHNEAIEFYKRAFAARWISYDAAALYARSLYAVGQKDAALKWGARALELVPKCIDCRQEQARRLADMGRKREAYNLLKQYDDSQKASGKREYFKGDIMLLEDELK